MSIVLASFTTTPDDMVGLWANVTNKQYLAQSFTLTGASVIDYVKLSFNSNLGSPTGDCEFRIENTTSSVPNGTLAHANLTKTQAIVASTWNTITFSSPGSVSGGLYAIWPKVTGGSDTPDHKWRIEIVGAGGYAGGNAHLSASGTSWDIRGYDCVFEVYGTVSPPVVISGAMTPKTFLWGDL